MIKKKITYNVKLIIVIFGAIFSFVSIAPYFVHRIIHIGVVVPFIFGLFLILSAVFWNRIIFNGNKIIKWVSRILYAIVGVILAVCIVVLTVIWNGGYNTKKAYLQSDEVTVVVLGCQVQGDKPSRMLRYRIIAAGEFLKEHPEANCVATGGVGNRSDIAESQMIKKWLVEKYNIDVSRIFTEEKSTNSETNITSAAQVIKENGLSEKIIIISSSFHVYRGEYYAKKYGFAEVSGLSARFDFFMDISYWFREIPAVLKAWVGL